MKIELCGVQARARAAVVSAPLTALLIALGACDGPVSETDGGPPDGGAPLEALAAPRLAPCPAGWTATVAAGVPACDPTGGPPRSDCPDGEAHLPGSLGCAPLGRACPAGLFADDLPASGVLYVQPGAAGGDGTRAAPFGALAEAMAAASPGSVVALAKGTYEEGLVLRRDVSVRGACAAETRLRLATPRSASGSVGVPAGVSGAVLADVTIGPSDNVGVLARGGSARLEGVVIESAQLFGVVLIGGRLEVDGLLVRGTRMSDGSEGAGVVVADGGELDAARVLLTDNHRFGIGVGDGCRATLRDSASRAQRAGAVPGLGAGLVVESSGTLRAERVELSDSLGVAAMASGGGTLEIEDAVVRRTRGVNGDQGIGLSALDGTIRARRVWIADSQGSAVLSLRSSLLDIADAIVTGTVEAAGTPGWAVGFNLGQGSESTLERVHVEGASAAAIAVLGVVGRPRGETRLVARDVSILDVEDIGASGVGLYLSGGVEALVSSLFIERATEAAIIVNEDSHLALSHARVLDTRPDPTDGQWGRGLEVVGGSDVEVEHARFEGQREVALIFSGGRARLEDVQVVGTRERACAASSCADAPGGIGLGVYGGAEVDVVGFVIDGAPLCGVQIASGGQLDLRDGEIVGAAVGACVQVPDYDLARLAGSVAYRDTGTSIQATSHHVPEVRDPLAL